MDVICRQRNCGRAAGAWMMSAGAHGGATGSHLRRYPVVVVGLGVTGLSCARLLRREGVSFAVADTRASPPCLDALRREMPEVPLFLGGLDGKLLSAAEQLVLSPGLTPRLPALQRARKRGVEFLGDIELFRLRAHKPIVAVTGTNGKSTVTTLLADMASRAGLCPGLGGNIGRPALELLDADYDLYVLEVSSFQLETVGTLGATAAAVLNVAPDHLDRYADLETYAAVKERVYAGCQHMIVNLDDKCRYGACTVRTRPGYTATRCRIPTQTLMAWCIRIAMCFLQTTAAHCCRCPPCGCPACILPAIAWRHWPWGMPWDYRCKPCWRRSPRSTGLAHRLQWVRRA